MSVDRKKRKDAGQNVFTCDAKRKAVHTEHNTFEELHRQDRWKHSPGEPIANEKIQMAFKNASTVGSWPLPIVSQMNIDNNNQSF